MRTALFWGILSFLIWSVLARYVYVCQIKHHCEQKKAVEKNSRPLSLSLMDGDSIILEGYEQLAFGQGSILPNLTLNNREFLDKIADYIKKHPEKNLTITGLFRASEKGIQSGIFENLGLARANILRNLLVERSIDLDRITLDHAMISGEKLLSPARFELFSADPEAYEAESDLAKTIFRFDNMTFSDANFEFNSDVFKPGAAFLTWADSLHAYFSFNEAKSLNIIGHTDNVGTGEYNQDLGLRRAQSAKFFLENKGIIVPITIETKGEQEPIATNDTETGRQKNRRVNFVILDEN